MTSGETFVNGYTVTVGQGIVFDGDDAVYEYENGIYAPTLCDAFKIAKLLSKMGQTVEKITAVYEPEDLPE